MDVVDLMRILLRRWYLVLPVVSLVSVIAFTYSDRIEPEYHAQGSMVLLPPSSVAPEESLIINPWQSIGTDATIEALTVVVQSEDFAERTRTAVGVAPGDTFGYEVLTENRSAVVTVEATAESPEQAIAAASIVKDGLQGELDVVQEEYGIPADLRTTFRTLNEPGLSDVLYPGQLQVRIAGLAAGVLAALVIALLGDRVLLWVGRRRREKAAAAAAVPAEATVGTTSAETAGPDVQTRTPSPVGQDPGASAAVPSRPTSPPAAGAASRPRWQVHSPAGDGATAEPAPAARAKPGGATGVGTDDGPTDPADRSDADEQRTPARAPGA